jgi:hypothetical protein
MIDASAEPSFESVIQDREASTGRPGLARLFTTMAHRKIFWHRDGHGSMAAREVSPSS